MMQAHPLLLRVSLFLLWTGLVLGQGGVGDLVGLPGQDLSNERHREDVVARMKSAQEARKQAAVARAPRMGWPLRPPHPNGRMAELVDMDGDRPIYYVTQNANAAISTGANLIRVSPYLADGTGVLVGEWDGGGARTTHQELAGRVTIMDGASLAEHSTHVCGTIAASGVTAAAKGMAPAVNVVSYDWTSDYTEMTAKGMSYPAEPNKIQLSNHSYGQVRGWYATGGSPAWYWYGTGTTTTGHDTYFGRYDSYANQVDGVAASLPYYLILRAAGNDRNDNPATGDYISLNSYGTSTTYYDPASHPPGDGNYKNGYDLIAADAVAKNVLTVGSVSDAVSGGARSVASANISSFSCWGPTDDGRIKPDVVANGESLYSTSYGSDTSYLYMSGTSMATPNATGSLALLVHYWSKLFPGQSLRASTLKGLVIHTADDRGTAGPDYSYGWGLINVKAAADLLLAYKSAPGTRRVVEDRITSSVTTRSYSITWDGTSPIRATLCWTDPKGTIQSGDDSRTANLVNDLDLTVTGPTGTTYLPFIMPYVGDWTPANFSAAATTGVNHRDNVEQVSIATPGAAGNYTITVSFTGSLSGGTQDFSLLVNGASTAATAAAPTLATCTPSVTQPVTGLVPVLTGSGFLTGATVRFTKSGQSDTATTSPVILSTTATLRLDATTMAAGYWDAVITNPDGQSAVLANALLVAAPATFWQSNLEGDTSGWTHSFSYGSSTSWALLTSNYHSSSHAFFASGPSTQNIDDLYSPAVFIPTNANNLQLTFWHAYTTQSRKDGGVLEFSVEGGAWFDVTSSGSGAAFASGGYNTTLNSTTNPLGNGRSVWSGTQSSWTQVVVNLTDLAKYVGKHLAARWRLASNSGTASTGWYLDDVALSAVLPPNTAPTITTAAQANPVAVTGTTTQLTVAATDDGGEPGLTYTWSASGGSPVTFSPNGTNGAKNTTATFTGTGNHTLTVTVSDWAGLTATSGVVVPVSATATSVTVTPSSTSVSYGGQVSFAAVVKDQFGNALTPQPTVSWSASGGGSISSAGLFTATAAGGPYTVTATSGSVSGTAQVTVTKAAATVMLDGLVQTYDGTPKPVGVTTVPAGLTVNVTYNGSATVPANAGTYAVVALINDANYSGSASGTLEIAKAAATVMLDGLVQTYDGTPKPVSVTTVPAGLTVNVTYDGSPTAPTDAGSYAVTATVSDVNHTGSATGTLEIAKAAATVTLDGLSQTFDGTPKPVSATTVPAGLTVNVTYNGSATVPTNAGSYAVVATVSDVNHTGSATGALEIAKAAATVTLDGLAQTYDGTPKPVSVTTVPAGLTVNVTYDGSPTAPTDAGSYAVVAAVSDANHTGSATGALEIAKAAATVTLDGLAQTYDGTPKAVSVTTAPSGLTVNVTYDGSPLAPSDAGTYSVVATIDDPNHQGSATASFVIAKAAATVTLGGLSQTYDGTPKSITATTAPPGLLIDITYDGSASPPVNAGSYAVTATINDPDYSGSESGTLVVQGESLAGWQTESFTPAEIESGASAAEADPDHDGLANLAEYALGTDPHAFTPALPAVKAPEGLVLTFTRPKDLPDVAYAAEASDDALNWHPVTLELVTDGPVQTLRAVEPLAAGDPARRFLRLRFTRTGP